jgi:hypothetical protein
MDVSYVRLYAGPDGESHFEDVGVTLPPVNFAPPAPPLPFAQLSGATNVGLLGAESDWFGNWHPAPRRQLFFTLTGAYEVTASDGEVRAFPAGAILLLEDTTGKGHSTRILGGAQALVAAVSLTD